MADRGDKAYLQPYREAVERHGPSFEATLWHSVEAQALRFDVMIGLVDLDGRSVLDAGCGQGDFAARLLERIEPLVFPPILHDSGPLTVTGEVSSDPPGWIEMFSSDTGEAEAFMGSMQDLGLSLHFC